MSITITTDVFCDGADPGKGCNNWTPGVASTRAASTYARQVAKQAGWLITKRGDFCPQCAKALAGEPK